MASTTRSILRGLSLGGSMIHGRRVLTHHTSRVFTPGSTQRGTRPTLSHINYGHGRRGYSSGAAGGTNWDGLVYSMMSNLRGQITYGPECFYADTKSSDDEGKERKDMRALVPLRLNRDSLGQTAQDIHLRLTTLCKSEQHSYEYATILRMVNLLERLAAMPSEDPKLELPEYVEIWTGIRDGVQAANQMPFQVLSINEGEELKHVKWNAEAVWGVAMLNAAVKELQGTRISDDHDDQTTGQERQVTFNGDLRSMAYKIHGLLLDSKDFFPEGRWFTTEQETQILGAIIRAYKEFEKRPHM